LNNKKKKDQCIPRAILTIRAIENRRTDEDDMKHDGPLHPICQTCDCKSFHNSILKQDLCGNCFHIHLTNTTVTAVTKKVRVRQLCFMISMSMSTTLLMTVTQLCVAIIDAALQDSPHLQVAIIPITTFSDPEAGHVEFIDLNPANGKDGLPKVYSFLTQLKSFLKQQPLNMLPHSPKDQPENLVGAFLKVRELGWKGSAIHTQVIMMTDAPCIGNNIIMTVILKLMTGLMAILLGSHLKT
jgi:hypothetical protein